MSLEEWVRFRQSREEKQSNEWSQKRKEWEHLERSKYITMYRKEAATKAGEIRRTKCGALGSLLERKRWLSVMDSRESWPR